VPTIKCSSQSRDNTTITRCYHYRLRLCRTAGCTATDGQYIDCCRSQSCATCFFPSCATAEQGDHEGVNRVSQVTSRPSHVRERSIGALIPDALGPRDESPSIPLPVLPTLSRLDDLDQAALLVSTTRTDHSGRIP